MPNVSDTGLIATSDIHLERRTAIKQLAALCGLALSATSLSLMAESFTSPRDISRRKNRFLKPEQLALVRELGELIDRLPDAIDTTAFAAAKELLDAHEGRT